MPMVVNRASQRSAWWSVVCCCLAQAVVAKHGLEKWSFPEMPRWRKEASPPLGSSRLLRGIEFHNIISWKLSGAHFSTMETNKSWSINMNKTEPRENRWNNVGSSFAPTSQLSPSISNVEGVVVNSTWFAVGTEGIAAMTIISNPKHPFSHKQSDPSQDLWLHIFRGTHCDVQSSSHFKG